VLVVRRKRSPSAQVPPTRRLAGVRPAEVRYRRPDRRQAGRAAQGSAAERAKAGARRVMIVDDEPSIRLVCSINFTASGWECREARDGEEALERIRAERPDVVLLDVMMPRLDGWSVAERVAADPATRDVPIVFLSARADQGDRERAHALGAIAYLTKPIDPVRLPDVVDELLRRLERGERDALRAELLADTQNLR
jgi:CheY-like chemotaxis protein